ncbi:MAG TPA: hypothetical protein VM802_29060 [Chitinophaga sp.]|uniref:hypothetical protein n=1 Tax=Chitinophaga sp. TaxID=1869181 RepID=UPI002B56C8A5|nr:hypothetical protein [Chitinophaga sp.]HVI48951.1 hypothetical protein [Chitinophaga sp.]
MTDVKDLEIVTKLLPLFDFTRNAHCELEGHRPQFLYTLWEGWSDLKIGRMIFEREGLPGLLGI